ncbi:FmdB family zinc ribbon protein [Brachybacterium subflavum]|uniref:FmdB family zinc ribbon protein n=1 Tax=Brachybacterium subflavum TaxID=2585206 RepID=UPI0012667FE2|nr:zinc ribbon domain-containing protein [Brachybacterium subflavum]
MPIYEFRCSSAHRFEVSVPMSGRDGAQDCPDCGAPAARLIAAPALGHFGSPAARLLESTQASAHSPGVVDAVPGGGAAPRRGTPVTRDPRHARLPRP